MLVVAEPLEAGGATERQLDHVGQVAVVRVEEPGWFARDQWQILLYAGRRPDAGPVVNTLDEVAGAGIGDRVEHLGEDVLRIGKLDDGGGLGGPE
jgi:hypothetical protein